MNTASVPLSWIIITSRMDSALLALHDEVKNRDVDPNDQITVNTIWQELISSGRLDRFKRELRGKRTRKPP